MLSMQDHFASQYLSHGFFTDGTLLQTLSPAYRTQKSGLTMHGLTKGQQRILRYHWDGLTNKEVASILGIDHSSVSHSLIRIRRNFGNDKMTTTMMIRIALNLGWIKEEKRMI